MKARYRLFRRKWGTYYAHDNVTRKQETLGTTDKNEAKRLLHAKNEAQQQPMFNMQIARAYWMASDPLVATRTWRYVMEQITTTKNDNTLIRWKVAMNDKAFTALMSLPLLQTRAEHLMHSLQSGTVSTNVYLRRAHNFAIGMGWLPCPIIPKSQWPKIRHKDKRSITWEEHQKIIQRELNPERKAFYELLWHIGGSQTDIATLRAEDIQWNERVLIYSRAKTGTTCQIRFGSEVEKILRKLPTKGELFPYLARVRCGDRATEFKQRCVGLGIIGVSLHSYRYGWAERAKAAGYPERYAQQALGHSSKAVHRAYSRKAEVTLPSLEEFESQQKKLVSVNFTEANTAEKIVTG